MGYWEIPIFLSPARNIYHNVRAISLWTQEVQCMKEGWNQNIDSNQKEECPIAAYYSHGSIPVLKDEILSAWQNRYHGAGECRPGIRVRQNFRWIIGAPGRSQGSQPWVIHEDGSWNREFKDHLKRYGIKPIVARVKHPLTNGKSGRFSGSLRESLVSFSFIFKFLSVDTMIQGYFKKEKS